MNCSNLINFNYSKLIRSFFTSIILFFHLSAHAIGYVETILGKAKTIIENEEFTLQELDEIFLNSKIFLDNGSELTILLDDGSTILVKNKSEFIFLEYEDIFSINPHYTIQIFEGDLIVETGELPKFKKNSTSIISPVGTLFLNGTAISAKLNSDLSEVFLMTDSFGDSGELVLQNDDGEMVNIEINSGISINDEGAQPIQLSEEVINNQKTIKNIIANSAISNETKIDEIIQKKIESGKLSLQEAKIYKEKILQKKEKKIDQIISSSNSDTSILGEVLKNSDSTVGSKILEKVVDNNPKVTSKVIDGVLDQNENLFKEISSKNSQLTDKILKTVVKEADENDQSLSKIIAKSDSSLSAKLMTEIVETKKDLMIKVVAETSVLNPEKLKELESVDEEISSKITSTIVEQLSESSDATEDMKIIMLNTDADLASEIIQQTANIDYDLVNQATLEIITEETEKITDTLSSSIEKGEENALSSLLISKAIETGNADIITKAVEKSIQKTTNNSNDSSNSQILETPQNNEDQTEEKIEDVELAKQNILKVNDLIKQEVDKLKITNPEIEIEENLLANVKEFLASPN